MDFQVGDVVKCVCDKVSHRLSDSPKADELTQDKFYKVVAIAGEFIFIIDDEGNKSVYYPARFIKIEGPIAEIEVLY